MSQSQLAAAAGVSRALVSTMERGFLERTSLALVRRVSLQLGVSIEVDPRWRGADLDKLMDERHALMVRRVVSRLASMNWQALTERTFSVWGERGSVDVLAWHAPDRALLVVEVKTKLPDLQDLLQMDRKGCGGMLDDGS